VRQSKCFVEAAEVRLRSKIGHVCSTKLTSPSGWGGGRLDQVAGSCARDTSSVAGVLLSDIGTFVLSTALSASHLTSFPKVGMS
jgi:hypothetical protein